MNSYKTVGKMAAVMAAVVIATIMPFHLSALGLGEDVTLASLPANISSTYTFQIETVATSQLVVTGGWQNYGVGFSAGGSGNYNNRTLTGPAGRLLQYQFLDSRANGMVIKDLNGAPDKSGLLTGTTVFNQQTKTFDLLVYQGQLVPPGQYNDMVTVTVYTYDGSAPGITDQKPMQVSVSVSPFVSLSVVNTGGSFDPGSDNLILDFGVLSAGVSRSLDVLVLANIDYTVTVDSANNGVMTLIPAGDGSYVPYTMAVDGTPQSLSSGTAQVLSGTGPTPLSGYRHTFDFEIGDPLDATSGTYEDNLTITVTAN
jgi:spore coat protein U-like protein